MSKFRRTKYPLQVPVQASGPASVSTTSPLQEANFSTFDRISKGPQALDFSITQSHPGTANGGTGCPVMSHSAGGRSLSSHPSTEETHEYAQSSTAVSISQRSASPQSPGQSKISQGAVDGNITELRSSTDSLSGEEDSDRMLNSKQPSGRNKTVKRTLRRTPRSRRISSSISIIDTENTPSPVLPTERGQSVSSTGTGSWQKQGYPSQSIMVGGHSNLPKSQNSMAEVKLMSLAPLNPVGVNTHQSSMGAVQDRQTDQRSTPGSVHAVVTQSPPVSPKHIGNANQPGLRQLQNAAGAVQGNTRQKYPLQAPASISNLHNSLTPPPSPSHDENKISAQLPAKDQAPAKSKTIRQKYPLQSPASVANLHPSPVTSQPTALLSQKESQQVPAKSKAVNRRQAYPLQSPASIAKLRISTVSPQQVESSPHIDNAPIAKKRKSKGKLHRQKYPLQTPVSIPNLQTSAARSSVAETETETERETPKGDEQLALQSVSQPRTDDLAKKIELQTKVMKHWRRMSYPVHSPENIEHSPTSYLAEEQIPPKPSAIHLPRNIRAVRDANDDSRPGRTIVLCLDGTGDKFDNDNSNIVHIVSALKKDDERQVTYYQAGIGTYGDGGLSGGVSAAMDMAVGSSLGLHVRDAYHFLMHTYKEGDKICIFSFSRGAYTARCVAGMVHKVGLLPPRNIQQIPFAYEFYANDTPEGWKQSEDFKKAFCIDVSVHFLGCFDSVSSVGFIPRQLPLSSTPTNKARYFRHAMALDERRAKFKVCRHQGKTWDEITKSGQHQVLSTASELIHHLPNHKNQHDTPPPQSPPSYHSQQESNELLSSLNLTKEEYDRIMRKDAPFETDVLEVWFAGAHADVGGGAVPNDERHKLAQIPLRWMIRQAFECNTGIIFKTGVLAEYGIDVHTLWPRYQTLAAPSHEPPPSFLEKYDKMLPPRARRRSKLIPIDRHEKGEHFYHLDTDINTPKVDSQGEVDWVPEQIEDFYDAMSCMNDQLEQAPTWWILEFWPVQYKVPRGPGDVIIRTGMNLGRYRGVEDQMPNVHWTVRHRAQHLGYKIRARTAPYTTWRTVV